MAGLVADQLRVRVVLYFDLSSKRNYNYNCDKLSESESQSARFPATTMCVGSVLSILGLGGSNEVL